MDDKQLEDKLLAILNSDEISGSAGLEEAEAAVENAFPHLDEKAKKAMARVMKAEMPTPEEIEQAEKRAQHNAEIKAKREADLKRRAERRAARGKLKRKRK